MTQTTEATTRQYFYNRLAVLRYGSGVRPESTLSKIEESQCELAYRFLNEEHLTDHEKVLLSDQTQYLLNGTEDPTFRKYATDLLTTLAIKEGVACMTEDEISKLGPAQTRFGRVDRPKYSLNRIQTVNIPANAEVVRADAHSIYYRWVSRDDSIQETRPLHVCYVSTNLPMQRVGNFDYGCVLVLTDSSGYSCHFLCRYGERS